jgi:hypothetical protein
MSWLVAPAARMAKMAACSQSKTTEASMPLGSFWRSKMTYSLSANCLARRYQTAASSGPALCGRTGFTHSPRKQKGR